MAKMQRVLFPYIRGKETIVHVRIIGELLYLKSYKVGFWVVDYLKSLRRSSEEAGKIYEWQVRYLNLSNCLKTYREKRNKPNVVFMDWEKRVR